MAYKYLKRHIIGYEVVIIGTDMKVKFARNERAKALRSALKIYLRTNKAVYVAEISQRSPPFAPTSKVIYKYPVDKPKPDYVLSYNPPLTPK